MTDGNANLACLLIIKGSGSLLKVFLEQHYLKAVKHYDKNCQLNQEKREIRKGKAKLTENFF